MDLVKTLVGYPMKELVPLIKELIAEDKEVILTARGNSMRPMVKNIRDAVILSAYKGGAAVGDVILYERKNGSFVLHRIVEVCEDGSFVLMGDFQCVPEKGIKESQIIAVLSGIIRKNKKISCTSEKYQRYSRFWTKSRFVRRQYLRIINLGAYFKIAVIRLFKKQS